MDNKITITGSHGYIGSHLCKLIKSDYIDLKIDLDIRDHNLSIDCDILIHLAALAQVEESVKNPLHYYDTNVNGTINLLNKFKGKHFIFASTGAADENLESPYAISKKICEDIIVEQCKKRNINFTIFRFYNVIGSILVLNQPIQMDCFMLYYRQIKKVLLTFTVKITTQKMALVCVIMFMLWKYAIL